MKPSYRKTPYTSAAMRLLYEQSVGFKKLVDAVIKESGTSVSADSIIADALRISTSLGDYTGRTKYYHPASILFTMYKASKAGFNPTDYDTLMLMTAMQKYSRYAYKWAELFKKAGFGADPHLYKKHVHPLHPPSGGAYRGFPLSYIRLRIPQGTSLDSEGRMVPASYQFKQINFNDPRIVALFGEVWIGVDNKGQRVFLASSKKPRVDLAELLQISSSSSGTSPRIPLDLDRVVAAKELPASLR